MCAADGVTNPEASRLGLPAILLPAQHPLASLIARQNGPDLHSVTGYDRKMLERNNKIYSGIQSKLALVVVCQCLL